MLSIILKIKSLNPISTTVGAEKQINKIQHPLMVLKKKSQLEIGNDLNLHRRLNNGPQRCPHPIPWNM